MAQNNHKSAQIMQAAEKLFATRRFHEITTDDIAREAHVGKGTIYRYFQDKDDLFFRTAMSGFDDLCLALKTKLPSDGDFVELLLAACNEITRFFERRRQSLRMMHGEEGLSVWNRPEFRKRWQDQRGNLVEALATVFAKGADEGQLREDLPPAVLAQFLLGMLRARAREMADMPTKYRSIETVIDLFCRGAFRKTQTAANEQRSES